MLTVLSEVLLPSDNTTDTDDAILSDVLLPFNAENTLSVNIKFPLAFETCTLHTTNSTCAWNFGCYYYIKDLVAKPVPDVKATLLPALESLVAPTF